MMGVKPWSCLGEQTCSVPLFFLPPPRPALAGAPGERGEGTEAGLRQLSRVTDHGRLQTAKCIRTTGDAC